MYAFRKTGRKFANKSLNTALHREAQELLKTHYPTKRHGGHDSYFYGFLCCIYDGIEDLNEIKKVMSSFFISSTKQLVVEDEDIKEFIEHAKKQKLIEIKNGNQLNLTSEGRKLVEASFCNTLFTSHYMQILMNKHTIMILTAICLIFLSFFKILIGFQIDSQGMISEGFENLTDLIKIGIIYLVAFYFKKDKLASVIIIGLMLITGFTLLWDSIEKLFNPLPIIPTIQAYLIGGCSIALNYGLMYGKSLIGRTSGNLSLLSDSKDSELNVKISLGVLIGLTFAIFHFYFVDAIVGIIISILIFKEGIEVLREILAKEEDFDITEIKVAADQIYENRLTGYLLGSIRREKISQADLIKKFETGLKHGRLYYRGFADFFYNNLGADIVEKHLNKLIKQDMIEKIEDSLILTKKGQKMFFNLKIKEYKERMENVDVGNVFNVHQLYCIAFIIILILLILYANQINSLLAGI